MSRRPLEPGVPSAALIGGLALTSGMALVATSGWLIVAASHRPQILTLLAVIVLVRAFGIARPALRYLERVRSHDAALRFLARERERTYRALIPLTPARLGRRGRGDVLTGVVDDLDDIAMAQIRVSVPVTAVLVTGVLAAAMNAVVLFPAAAVTAATVVAALAVGALDHAVERRTQARVVTERARVGQLTATITGQAMEIAAVGGGAVMSRRLREAEEALERALARQGWGRAVGVGLAPLVVGCGSAVMAFVVEPYVRLGLPTPLAALLVLTPVAMGEAVSALPDAMGSLARSRAARERLDGLLGQTPAVAADDESDAVAGARSPGPSTGDVRDAGSGGSGANGELVDRAAVPDRLPLGVQDLEASWDGTRTALPSTTTTVDPGEFVAVTGPNGAGKSTLLAVLARHLDPSAGLYTQDGRDVRSMPLPVSRSPLAVVDDETHVLATTVRQNLLFARPDAPDTELVEALRAAGLGTWFAALPDGLDTRLGAGFRGLSGGERTRLGLARALVSARPVLLLDEPTAHLDTATAADVLAEVHRARGDRSVVLVTHRDVDALGSDRSVVLHRP